MYNLLADVINTLYLCWTNLQNWDVQIEVMQIREFKLKLMTNCTLCYFILYHLFKRLLKCAYGVNLSKFNGG